MVYMDGVAMIDADDFKEINDKYGHMVGDLALKAYTEGVFSVIRSTDILIRYGGDEFVLLINHVLKDVLLISWREYAKLFLRKSRRISADPVISEYRRRL